MVAKSLLPAIKMEIITDPAGVGYAGKDAASQAALMNSIRSQSPQQFVFQVITPQQIALALIQQGKWEAVKVASDSAIATGHSDAFRLWNLASLAGVSADVSSGALKTIIDNLVTAGVLAAGDRTAIAAIARIEVMRSRSQVLGADMVDQGDIQSAMII